jgi:hypothetical protein
MSSNYLSYIQEAYVSLEQPDFAFVKKTVKARPYEKLLKRMRDYAAIEEITEGEDDVCVGYLLKGRNALWKLDLSLVGPFAIFVRLSNSIKAEDFVHATKHDIIEFERKVASLLQNGGVKLLSSRELETKVDMSLINTRSDVRIYQALFCDTPNLPWVNS